MNDIMKIAQTLNDSIILLKKVTKTIKNETKEEKGGLQEKELYEQVMGIKKWDF